MIKIQTINNIAFYSILSTPALISLTSSHTVTPVLFSSALLYSATSKRTLIYNPVKKAQQIIEDRYPITQEQHSSTIVNKLACFAKNYVTDTFSTWSILYLVNRILEEPLRRIIESKVSNHVLVALLTRSAICLITEVYTKHMFLKGFSSRELTVASCDDTISICADAFMITSLKCLIRYKLGMADIHIMRCKVRIVPIIESLVSSLILSKVTQSNFEDIYSAIDPSKSIDVGNILYSTAKHQIVHLCKLGLEEIKKI